jgi:hypothetical protein
LTMSKRIELELWEVERLIPYAKNAKKHSKDQVVTLAGLIQKYGFTQPILVDAKGSIVAGHGRRLAAIHLKLAKVPVRVLYGYTREEVDALRMADNRVASTDYDTNLLAEELARLAELDFDLSGLGFNDQELDFLKGASTETIDDSLFIDDVGDAVETQKKENADKQEETDTAAAPVADALGFKRVTVAQSRKIRSFISALEATHEKTGVEALLAHINEVEEFA